jgi:hypothetical protein
MPGVCSILRMPVNLTFTPEHVSATLPAKWTPLDGGTSFLESLTHGTCSEALALVHSACSQVSSPVPPQLLRGRCVPARRKVPTVALVGGCKFTLGIAKNHDSD